MPRHKVNQPSLAPACLSASCLEAGGAQKPLRPSEGLAGVVAPHLLVAVRFPPTREGSGTKSTGRRPENRASFQVSHCTMPYAIGYATGYCRTTVLVVISFSISFSVSFGRISHAFSSSLNLTAGATEPQPGTRVRF